MRRDQRRSGLVIEVPDAYEELTAERTRGRRRAADTTTEMPSFDEVDAAFAQALVDQDMDLVDEFEYELDPRKARSARGRSTGEQSLSVSVTAEPGESAIALIEQDGVYSWQFPVGAAPGDRRRSRRSAEPEVLRFEIPLSDAAPGADRRSVFSAVTDLAGRIKGRVLKTATGAVLGLMEAKVEPGLVVMRPEGPQQWSHLDDPAELGLATDRENRLLVFVHGTFSSTVGSFHSLAGLSDDGLFADMWKRYDAVIGFDHPTLSVDPEKNALELLQALQRASGKGLVFDAVSYSRGGLVLRSLVESLLPQSGFAAHLETAVFVGATNEGTALADPENWRDFVDVYTNLALGAARAASLLPNAAPVALTVGAAVKGLGAFVKFLVDHAIDEGAVPGLAAMKPDGPFVREINGVQPGQPTQETSRYFAVTSDFEGGATTGGLANELPKKFLMTASDPVVDRLMRNQPNDLVVDTRSMTSIDRAAAPRAIEALDFGQNSVVYHTVYFTQEALAARLRTWLGLGTRSTRGAGSGERRNPLTQLEGRVVTAEEIVPPAPVTPRPEREPERPVLEIEVIWDDITNASGDVYAAGHYIGVVPQRAEKALDFVVSDSTDEEDLVLTRLTRSNVLRGELGEISFFPWGGSQKRNRLIAICGMGHYGPFGSSQLRRLYYNLAQSIMAFPDSRTICCVLIGAGEGALRTDVACTQLVNGFADAIRATKRGERIRRIRIVEMLKVKADEVQAALTRLAEDGRTPVDLRLKSSVIVGGRGVVSDEVARTLLVRAASRAGGRGTGPVAFEDLEMHLPDDISAAVGSGQGEASEGEDVDSPLRRQLRAVWDAAHGDVETLLQVTRVEQEPSNEPQRIAFIADEKSYRISAITQSATVPERSIRVDPGLIAQAVEQMTDPLPGDVAELSELLFSLTLPRDFRELMAADAPLIFEVNRGTASVHWEMLASGTGGVSDDPIGLLRPVARQLRTQYSETISLGGAARRRTINALVIGDPGDPDEGLNLPHARVEARKVARMLSDLAAGGLDIEVDLLIGAPNYTDRGVPPATRLEVVRRLLKGDVDLVHYSGHGDFDPDDPSRSGWLFHDGLLTAGEIERVDVAPAVVVANACLSGRMSTAMPGASGWRPEASLLPSLADEFLNRGVRNYIGTAWEIDDEGATEFAKAFYGGFLNPQNPDATIGDALLEARKTVREWERRYAPDLVLWAAYQHYGDPGFRASSL